jgi:selenocysteine-specific elongation factor
MALSPNTRVVLGTAGHIDHGKTSLVKALTGIDTDRLREEKERGITIELGFAHLRMPSGIDLAVVDVPGHERFVRTMVAGATGIDLVLLVVAADEGAMPQTREHLDICSLLGVKAGLVALTKADLVDPDFLDLAREDVAEVTRGTFLEGAPVLPVSATTGEGLPDLVMAIDALAASVPQKNAHGIFRLPVDRVFTMRGFGTVVTGTIVSGTLRRDDEVELVPRRIPAKVRGIQVHGQAVDKAYAGQRAALNLAGPGVEDLDRGDTVMHPGTLTPTYMIDARLDILPSVGRGLRDRSRVRLHLGTQEVRSLVALLDRPELKAGESAFVQIRCAEPVVACPGDRFVLRAFSPARTIGGGTVVDHLPRRHKGRKDEVIAELAALEGADEKGRLEVFLQKRGPHGMDPAEVQAALGVSLEESRNLLQGVVRKGGAVVVDRRAQRHVGAAVVSALEDEALDLLARYHADNPLRRGLGVEELRTKFPAYLSPKLVEFVISRLAESGRAALEGELVRRGDFAPKLSTDDEELRSRVLAFLEARRYEAPTADEVAVAVDQDGRALVPVLDYLVGQGLLTRTKEGFYFPVSLLEEFTQKVVAILVSKGEIGVADIKELTGTSRKYTIPLLEYLDSRKITMRKGEVRVAGPKGRS